MLLIEICESALREKMNNDLCAAIQKCRFELDQHLLCLSDFDTLSDSLFLKDFDSGEYVLAAVDQFLEVQDTDFY